MYFYPRSPYGERHNRIDCYPQPTSRFLSTLSLRRATTLGAAPPAPQGISIHALLTESDHPSLCGIVQHTYFYPRSPYGERQPWGPRPQPPKAFLSTLSLRRATVPSSLTTADCPYFYPRSPYGERPSTVDSCSICSSISIHALLTESDGAVLKLQCILGNFYPRSPYGERRYIRSNVPNFSSISIHALLTESDWRECLKG